MSMAASEGSMPMLDEAFGRFDETSKHPFFGLPCLGGQWPEERTFARLASPHAIARLAQVLCGLQGLVLHGADAGDSVIRRGITLEDRDRFARAIGTVIECLVVLSPEMLSDEPVAVEKELDLPPYVADERMVSIIARAFKRAGLDVPDILQNGDEELMETESQAYSKLDK